MPPHDVLGYLDVSPPYSSNFDWQLSDMLKGVFVSASGFLGGQPGGAQACTTEYIQTLNAAGIDLEILPYELDKRISSRLFRKVWPSHYIRHHEQGLFDRIRIAVESTKADFVFLNQVQLAPVAQQLRRVLSPNCRIVALSHGLESTDLLHTLRFTSGISVALPKYALGKQLLGDTLVREAAYRSSLDLVLCLSPFDVELEHWLGARNAVWIPRTVSAQPLSWNPMGNRAGFVGTLDHAPNLEGLILFLRSVSQAAPANFRVRLVGSPPHIGLALVSSFPFVDYLGPSSDDELMQEASTWNCFIHPIFCYPRGCSTKLATAIGWQIPIVTTTPGRRGYTWERGELLIEDRPDAFSLLVLSLLDTERAQRIRDDVAKVAQSSPTISSVGRQLAELLGSTSSAPGDNTMLSHMECR